MHSEVQQDQPGTCPKCGMQLIPVEEQQPSQAQASETKTYSCPMHPEVRQDHPGKCPTCGMALVPVAEPVGNQANKPEMYTCPMHPDVRQDQPGPCPKCGMQLIPVQDSPQPQESSAHRAVSMEHSSGSHHAMPGEQPGGGSDHASHAMHIAGHEMTMQSTSGSDHEMNMAGMTPRQYYQMMVDMAMSTAQLPWAIALGIASALLLIVLVIQTPWTLSPVGPTQDATTAVGELLLSRYMIGFEGAAFLILAGIAGAVILAKRERAPLPTLQTKQVEAEQAKQQLYTCPMHPDVRQNQPGTCPKCSMNLIPVEETPAASSHSIHGGHA